MSNNVLEDIGLRMEGFTDPQISQIETAIPIAQELVELVQKNEPVITQAFMLIQKLMPTLDTVLTVLKEKQS